MKFEFKIATDDDALQLSVLLQQVYIDTYDEEGVSLESSKFIRAQFSIQKIQSDLQDSNVTFWVATYKGNLVGALKLVYKNTCPIEDVHAPEVDKLYILRRFFGQGVGQELLRCAEQELKEKDIPLMWLWVYEGNERAIRFYNKFGFKNIGTAYFEIEENKYMNIVMSKEAC